MGQTISYSLLFVLLILSFLISTHYVLIHVNLYVYSSYTTSLTYEHTVTCIAVDPIVNNAFDAHTYTIRTLYIDKEVILFAFFVKLIQCIYDI